MIKILVVEDDHDLSRLVSAYLRNSGMEVTTSVDGSEALIKIEENKYDMVLTDVMMPNLDGFGLAEAIRVTDKTTPIIFMTAREDKPAKMLGYSLGIDDFIVKPFDLDELVMKIKAVVRRAQIQAEKEITIGNFTMNKEERVAKIGDEEITLTVREFDLLFKMLSYPKKTFTRSSLMDEFWDYDSSATSRTVDVYMAKIREKTALCDGFSIVTVHGLGYKVVLK